MLWEVLQIQPTTYDKVVKERTLMWDIMCIFMPFSKTFQCGFLKLPIQILVSYVKVGSTNALNRGEFSSQQVNSSTASILKVPVKAYIPTIFAFH